MGRGRDSWELRLQVAGGWEGFRGGSWGAEGKGLPRPPSTAFLAITAGVGTRISEFLYL